MKLITPEKSRICKLSPLSHTKKVNLQVKVSLLSYAKKVLRVTITQPM